MRRAWPVVVALALAAIAGPAQAQTSGQIIAVGVPGGHVLSDTNIPIRVTGQMVVTFQGDAAAGCAAYGLCPYAGTIVASPSNGELTVATIRQGKRTRRAVGLFLGTGEAGVSTSAHVQRSTPGGESGMCADANVFPFFGSPGAVTIHGRAVTIRALAKGGSLLRTRCAGPLDGDLAGVSPAATVSLGRALHGRETIDLSGTRTFAVHGFAGTVSSTLVFKLGKPATQQPSSVSFPPGIKTQRTRIVTERLRGTRLTGGLSAAVSGTADPVVCGLLDTCGLTGSLALSESRRGVTAEVNAMGPASRPYRDFLTALGLARGGRSSGISVLMTVALFGRVQEQISQPGVTCTDTAAAGVVSAEIGIFGRSRGGAAIGPWRTRCPGPLFNLNNSLSGVVASLPAGALEHRQVTVRLRGTGSFSDDGYVVSVHGEESVDLRRGRVTSLLTTFPTS